MIHVLNSSTVVLPRLISDLQSFLSLLDSENLSYIAQAQKKSISELLSKLQTNDSPGDRTVLTGYFKLKIHRKTNK